MARAIIEYTVDEEGNFVYEWVGPEGGELYVTHELLEACGGERKFLFNLPWRLARTSCHKQKGYSTFQRVGPEVTSFVI